MKLSMDLDIQQGKLLGQVRIPQDYISTLCGSRRVKCLLRLLSLEIAADSADSDEVPVSLESYMATEECPGDPEKQRHVHVFNVWSETDASHPTIKEWRRKIAPRLSLACETAQKDEANE